MINEAIISVISTKSISTIIDFTFEHVLFNDIIVYNIETIIFQLIIAVYNYSDIWKDREITIDISEAKWISIFIKSNVLIKAICVYSFD